MIFKRNDSIEKLKLDKDFEDFLVRKNIKSIKDLFEYDYNKLKEVFISENNKTEVNNSEINIYIDFSEIPVLQEKDPSSLLIASDGFCYRNFKLSTVKLNKAILKKLNNESYFMMVDIIDLTEVELSSFLTGIQTKILLEFIKQYKEDNLLFRYRISGLSIPYSKLAFSKFLTIELEKYLFDSYKSEDCYSEVVSNYEELVNIDLAGPLDTIFLDDDDKMAIASLPAVRSKLITYVEELFQADVFAGLTFSDIAKDFVEFLNYDVLIRGLLNEMISKDYLYYEDGLYYLELPNLPYLVNGMPTDLKVVIAQSVLMGLAIEDIAFDYEIDELEVEKLAYDFLNEIETVYEDRYARLFQEYYLLKSDFMYAFDDNEYVYLYLSIKYKRGHKFISSLATDDSYSQEFRDAAISIINREINNKFKS